jgi:predicted Zn-dependent peptidase
MMVSAGIDGGNYIKTKQAILDELEDVKNGKIEDIEFDNSVRSAVNAYKEINDRPGQICSYYFARILQGSLFTPEDEIKRLLSLTASDAVKAANNLTLDTIYLLEGVQ